MTTITNGEGGASVRGKLNAALAVTDLLSGTTARNLDTLADQAHVAAAIAALVASSPAALDTLNELAAALGNDANFATTMTAALAGKAATTHTHFKGDWNPGSGSFPGGGAALAGEIWRCSAGGTVNSITFTVGDMVMALANNASTATYAGNWIHIDITMPITSVAGLTGVITATALTAALNSFAGSLKGLVPASGGGTTNYLRADGTWAAPAGGGGATGTTYYNGTGGSLPKGTVVCLAAYDAGSGNPGMAKADADGAGLMPCIGILGADVASGASGIPVITGGEVTGIDTSAWSLGDTLYVDTTAGVLTDTRPATGYVQPVAIVSRVDASAGEIIVALGPVGQLIGALTLATTIDGTERFPISGDEAMTTALVFNKARQVDYIAETTTARSLTAGDHGSLIGAQNAGATTITIPANATTALPVGFTCHISADTGATVTIDAEAGVSLNGVSGGATTVSTQYRGVVTLHKTAADTWFARGDCAAVA